MVNINLSNTNILCGMSFSFLVVAYNDCGSSDDNNTQKAKDGNSSTSSTDSDDTDGEDVDFFGLSCKTKVRH